MSYPAPNGLQAISRIENVVLSYLCSLLCIYSMTLMTLWICFIVFFLLQRQDTQTIVAGSKYVLNPIQFISDAESSGGGTND